MKLPNLRLLFGVPRPATTRFVDLGDHDGPVYAIGDIHGCHSLFRRTLREIEKDARKRAGTPLVVALGDVVDRGPDSAAVIEDFANSRALCMLGNHERMMLSFLDDPEPSWDWLSQGGFETLLSYGLSLSPSDRLPRRRLRQMLDLHVPEKHRQWLRALPHGYLVRRDGQRFILVHAGIDPTRPLHQQAESAVLWGRDVSLPDDGFVVQGHVIVDAPEVSARHARIDTGAHRTGRLTTLCLPQGSDITVLTITNTGDRQDPSRRALQGKHSIGKH